MPKFKVYMTFEAEACQYFEAESPEQALEIAEKEAKDNLDFEYWEICGHGSAIYFEIGND